MIVVKAFPNTYICSLDVIDWLHENVGYGRFHSMNLLENISQNDTWGYSLTPPNNDDCIYMFAFRTQEAATLFKLVWF